MAEMAKRAVYLITGASSGIGLEMTKQLAARGDKVFATCRARASSGSGVDAISTIAGDVTVIEGIDMTDDAVGAPLRAALEGVELDVVVHNAGSVNGTRALSGMAVMGEQKFDLVSMERMRAAFEVNTLGPLKVQQAVDGLMKAPGGKVVVISTGFASIGDNGSGGTYAYRTSKAAVNMVTKSMACDFKERGVAVAAVAPGILITEFGPGAEAMTKFGAKPVDQGVTRIIEAIDGLQMETTGQFLMIPTAGGPAKEMPW